MSTILLQTSWQHTDEYLNVYSWLSEPRIARQRV